MTYKPHPPDQGTRLSHTRSRLLCETSPGHPYWLRPSISPQWCGRGAGQSLVTWEIHCVRPTRLIGWHHIINTKSGDVIDAPLKSKISQFIFVRICEFIVQLWTFSIEYKCMYRATVRYVAISHCSYRTTRVYTCFTSNMCFLLCSDETHANFTLLHTCMSGLAVG